MKKETLSSPRRMSGSAQSFKSRTLPMDPAFGELQQMVKKYGVCWDIQPLHHIDRDGKLVQIGFEFSLTGTHSHTEDIIEPGCPRCVQIYKDLQRIVRWIVPRGAGNDGYEMVIVDALPHYSSQRRFKPDVLQIIKVIRREGFDNCINAFEVRCLMEMKAKTETLGIGNTNIRPD